MEEKKLIFLDIDGTIRAFDGTIAESTKEAIQRARKKGHQVFICSGRRLGDIEKKILDIGFDGILANSGGHVIYEGREICHIQFTKEDYADLLRDIIANKDTVLITAEDRNYLLGDPADKLWLAMKEEVSTFEIDMEIWTTDMPAEQMESLPHIEKLIRFSNHRSSEELEALWGTRLQVVSASVPFAAKYSEEITPLEVTKAKGIQALLEATGFKREQTIAIGDSSNDKDMLLYAQTGIAMGNAAPQIQAAADYVTTDVTNDGIYHAFVHFGII